MLAGRAVEMQKDGMGASEIAEALGTNAQQVVAWWQMMGYDPVAYHIDSIVQQMQNHVMFYDALARCGMSAHGALAAKVREALRERGIIGWRASDPNAVARRKGQRYCRVCGILLEPYDPNNAEQRSWQNGTRDGIHCEYCANAIAKGLGRPGQQAQMQQTLEGLL